MIGVRDASPVDIGLRGKKEMFFFVAAMRHEKVSAMRHEKFCHVVYP